MTSQEEKLTEYKYHKKKTSHEDNHRQNLHQRITISTEQNLTRQSHKKQPQWKQALS